MKLAKYTLVGIYLVFFSAVLMLILNIIWSITQYDNFDLMQWLNYLIIGLNAAYNIVLAIINIINSIKLFRNNDYNSLRKYMKLIKLGAVPYFLVNFIFYFCLYTVGFILTLGLAIFSVITPILITYLSVLYTSVYGIGFTALLYKQKKLTAIQLLIHVLLQICFILDVISTIILLVKNKPEKNLSIISP
ncbi:MAG: DUF6652 family protein [Eubacteriaceae bacterium]